MMLPQMKMQRIGVYETESHFHCVDHVILSSAVLGTLFSCCECSSEDLTFFLCLLGSL